MLVTCFYFDERDLKCKKTSLQELKELEYSNRDEFLYRQKRLYRTENKKIPMVLVRNGLNQGFRRKGDNNGNGTDYSRGERESLTHQGNKEAIATLNQLIIKFNNEEVTLYIRNIEMEKSVICNGTRYEVDLFLELERTEPEEYFNQWEGELWFEIFHTCKVDSKQAEDFSIENKTLFEYKVPPFYNILDNISPDGYRKRKEFLVEEYKKKGVYGVLICWAREETLSHWKLSENGNWTAKIGSEYFTIIKSKYDGHYGIVFGKKEHIWKYNNKKF